MYSIVSTYIDLLAMVNHQFNNSFIVNNSSIHNKEAQIVLASASHKHVYIQYHMYYITSTHNDLHTLLIHQLDNTFIINHSSMHQKEAQIVLASAVHKDDYILYHIHSIASTHINLLAMVNHQFNNPFIVNNSSMQNKEAKIV